MLRQNICPTCKTVISAEQRRSLQKTHRLGGGLGLLLGMIGAGLGVYFGLTAGGFLRQTSMSAFARRAEFS